MLISIIVPVYNVEKYLRRCVDSILAQTFTDFELILVDDGSPDNCGKICDDYSAKDCRVRVIHKENGGLSDARNAGIEWALKNSDSEWITFIDSDDWIHPKYLEALYNAVQQTGCSLSVCGFERTEGEEPVVDENALHPTLYNSEEMYCEKNVNAIVAWGKLYKKSDFIEIRYPVGKLHEDEFTTYKILFKYESIAFVDQPLYFYFQNSSSITNSNWHPKKLQSIEAYKEEVKFFENSRYNKAFCVCLKNLCWNYYKHYKSITETNDKHIIKGYTPFLKKGMRKTLRMAGKFDLLPLESNYYFYEFAYPFEMTFYWYWQGIKNKLKRN